MTKSKGVDVGGITAFFPLETHCPLILPLLGYIPLSTDHLFTELGSRKKISVEFLKVPTTKFKSV